MELMIPNHPRWHEFTNTLLGAQGCDVRTGDEGEVIWQDHRDFRITRSVLRAMGDFDASRTIEYLNKVYTVECDSTVLTNCAPERLEEWLKSHARARCRLIRRPRKARGIGYALLALNPLTVAGFWMAVPWLCPHLRSSRRLQQSADRRTWVADRATVSADPGVVVAADTGAPVGSFGWPPDSLRRRSWRRMRRRNSRTDARRRPVPIEGRSFDRDPPPAGLGCPRI